MEPLILHRKTTRNSAYSVLSQKKLEFCFFKIIGISSHKLNLYRAGNTTNLVFLQEPNCGFLRVPARWVFDCIIDGPQDNFSTYFWPLKMANSSAFLESLSSMEISAPFDKSNSIMLEWPFCAARWSGVVLVLSRGSLTKLMFNSPYF